MLQLKQQQGLSFAWSAGGEERGLVWVHGNVAAAPGTLGFMRSARKEMKGELLRVVFANGASPPAAELVEQCRRLDLFVNMFVDGRNGSYRSIAVEVCFHSHVMNRLNLVGLLACGLPSFVRW